MQKAKKQKDMEVLDMAEYNLKNMRKEFKEKGIFYTPEELALYLKSLFPNPQAIKEIYDPTCESGNLLRVFDDDVAKYGQDINAEQLEEAKQRLKNFYGEAGDTLQNPQFMGKKFDFIVANYPFSVKWEPLAEDERFQAAPAIPTAGKADYAFILHILYYLSEKGIAVTLNFPGILYRGNKEGRIRKWIIENNWIEKIIHIEGNTFVDTKIATCVIIFNKAKENQEILFVDGEKQKSISLKEIAENNYNLSVSTYIEKEDTREKIDIVKLNAEIEENVARQNVLRTEIDKIIAEIEGSNCF